VVISGAYGKLINDDFLLKKITSITRKKISSRETIFKKNYLFIISGITSDLIDQGQTFCTSNNLLFGKVFQKNDHLPFRQELIESKENIKNKEFTKKFWGNYLYFTMDDKYEKVSVLRDPVGQLPLFYTKLSDGRILFSTEISILHDIMELQPSLNWLYFSSYLKNPFISLEETPFVGIKELPNGCDLTLSVESIVCSSVWNPDEYINNYQSSEQLKQKILDISTYVIKSRTKSSESIILDFSGGLDSSALLFLINQAKNENQALVPINFFHPQVQSSDERIHAHKIAREIGLSIIEFDMSNSLPLTPLQQKLDFKPNWPSLGLTRLKMEQDLLALAKNYKAELFVSGHGGDHIFLCSPPIQSLCDCLVEKGARNTVLKIKELATIYRTSIFPILKKTLSGFYNYYCCSLYAREHILRDNNTAPWIRKEILHPKQKLTEHPYFLGRDSHILPGKFKQIDIIYEGLASIKGEVRNSKNPIFFPFFSQPMMELSLSIPTYESYAKGTNRFPFRSAIAEHFKTTTAWRKDKGEITGVMQRGFKKNQDFIFELCLEGRVSREGLIDRGLLHQNLKGMISGKTDFLWNIMNLMSLELYLDIWEK